LPGLSSAAGAGLEKISEDTLTADGTEQTVVESTSSGEVEGFIDLSNMASGDSITLRLYKKMTEGGTYRQFDSGNYSDSQTNPALHITKLPNKYGLRITLQQTAGVNRSYDYIFFRRA